ncbi:MAG: hypothetical protein M1826_005451 [Phylliscum demangeonii]|nr:MAG: hypothetical protein M1826_005451 [Phylliscum demangeonii]
MSTFPATNEPALAASMRVLRAETQLGELLQAFPSLSQKSLADASTLTDTERRELLDLPMADEEAENIRQAGSLGRDELLAKAARQVHDLTERELVLLRDRFWSPATMAELDAICDGFGASSEDSWDWIRRAREPAYLLHEKEAFAAAAAEHNRRDWSSREQERRQAADVARPSAPDWMRRLEAELEQRQGDYWGFVCLFDGEAQQMDPVRLDRFMRRVEGALRQTMLHTGARNLIDQRWRLQFFNAPITANAPAVEDPAGGEEGDDGAALREAFHALLQDPSGFQYPGRASDAGPSCIYPGLLTNTFLVANRTCIDSVLHPAGWLDDMRLLAFEADFPPPPPHGRTSQAGYKGWMWVRLAQLVHHFYEARCRPRPDQIVPMHELWQAAQQSKNHAFVCLDPDQAKNWTTSTGLSGPLPGSSLE